jgi:hypothetical protein
MALPNFLCVATVKGGTTTLHDILKQHPDILLPSARKELRFFDVDENYTRGLGWYEEFFSERTNQQAIGEIAPTYAYQEEVPQRMARDLGTDVKLIFSLRNPVDRAYSHYIMNCQNRSETHDFARALDLEPERTARSAADKARFSYVDQGRYAVQVERFLERFPRRNVLFLTFEEDLLENRADAVRKVCEHIGVSAVELDLDVWSYAGKPVSVPVAPWLATVARSSLLRGVTKSAPVRAVKGLLKKPVPKKLDSATRRRLLDRHFASDIEKLERLIGRDLRRWYASA